MGHGISIVVVKTGQEGCVVGYDGKIEEFPQQTDNAIIDITLIGSVFCGGFLHCIARGYDPFRAARYANSVALFKGIKGSGIDALPTADDLTL